MKRLVFILPVLLVLFAAGSVSAQSRDPYFTDFSVNYDAVYNEPNATSNAGAHFDLASTWKRDSPFIGPVLEVGFNRFDAGTVISALGGLRVRANVNRRILPFAQVLLGLYHCGVCDTNDLALQGGGGIDVVMADGKFRIRGQVDVRRVFDEFSAYNAGRFSLGIVLPLNR